MRHGWLVFHGNGEFNKKGLYLYTPQDGLFKLLSNGDQVDGKTIVDAKIGAKSLQGNNLAMVLDFKDGSKGVYVATIKISAY